MFKEIICRLFGHKIEQIGKVYECKRCGYMMLTKSIKITIKH